MHFTVIQRNKAQVMSHIGVNNDPYDERRHKYLENKFLKYTKMFLLCKRKFYRQRRDALQVKQQRNLIYLVYFTFGALIITVKMIDVALASCCIF